MLLLSDSLFAESKEIFQEFLSEQKISPDLLWVFQEDVLLRKDAVLVKVFNPNKNEDLAEELYEIGRKRNLGICFHAFALLDSRPCCYIQLPSDQDEAERLLIGSSYLKCSIRNPLLKAKPLANTVMWNVHKISYGSFQELPSKTFSFAFTNLSID